MFAFVWDSIPFMTAIFTIVFLILIRIWTRDESDGKVKKTTKKIGDAIKTTRKAAESFCDTTLDLDIKDTKDTKDSAHNSKSSKHRTTHLDVLFFGELFLASAASGVLISFGWAKS